MLNRKKFKNNTKHAYAGNTQISANWQVTLHIKDFNSEVINELKIVIIYIPINKYTLGAFLSNNKSKMK